MKYNKVLFIPDVHCPYQDPVALKALYSFMDWFKPNEVFILGDLVDFYAISSFSKDPERALKLQDEIDQAVEVLSDIRKHAKKAKLTFITGNHCLRLRKYLWNNAKELEGLRALKLESLLCFDQFKINYEERGILKYKGIIIKHGTVVRKYAGYTAKAEFEKNGTSGISGHSHRMSMYRHTNELDSFVWVESGCLCKLDAEYLEGETPNWSSGFAIGYFKENSRRFLLETVPIINGKAMYGGKEF